jgi:hypothetical protein
MTYVVTYQSDDMPEPLPLEGRPPFTTGREANDLRATMASFYPHITYRVSRKAPSEAEAANWQAREEARFASGEYQPVPWAMAMWRAHPTHYVHVSKKDLGKIAFTETSEKGAADRQTVMSPGRYLTRFYADVLTPAKIGTWAARVSLDDGSGDDGIRFATTADEMETAYTSASLGSCMSYGASHFEGHCHPVRVYAAGDLAVATLERDGVTVARCLAWPEKKTYGPRVYGDAVRFEAAMAARGYTEATPYGARIAKLEDDNGRGFIMPYLDGGLRLADKDGGFAIYQSGTGLYHNGVDTQNTEGVTEEEPEDERSSCDNCGARMDDDDATRTASEDYICSHCAEHYYQTCAVTGDLYRQNEMTECLDEYRTTVWVSDNNLEDFVEVGGEMLHIDLTIRCTDCDEHIDADDGTEGDDGETRCAHHHAEYLAEAAQLALDLEPEEATEMLGDGGLDRALRQIAALASVLHSHGLRRLQLWPLAA